MKRRYLRPIVQDFLTISVLWKFFLLAIIDDYKVSLLSVSLYLGTGIIMFLEARLLIKYGGKKSLFYE